MTRFTLPIPIVITALVVIVSASLAVLGQPRAATLQPRIAPEPVIIIATAKPGQPVIQAAAGNTTRTAMVAYASPGGIVLGAIEAGRPYRLLARYGADWLQIDADGSGQVWVKAPTLLGLPDVADIQPTATPEVIVISAPPVEAPADVQVDAPAEPVHKGSNHARPALDMSEAHK
jgi:hypothetical protein